MFILKVLFNESFDDIAPVIFALAANGFTNVYNVLPGMSEWQGETAQTL